MPKVVQNQLTARRVATVSEPGQYVDGQGLRLQVTPSGVKSWIFRYTLAGKTREMGLGPLGTVSLVEARERARSARQQVLDGLDPIDTRAAAKVAQRIEDSKVITFDKCSESYIKSHKAGWSNEKHAEQWTNTLATYASPVIGKVPVSRVDTSLVLRVIEPIWHEKTETANRVRGRIEKILDWAKARGYREGENPARWKGHLDHTLPKRSKVSPVKHHEALPYSEVASFLESVGKQPGTAARALEFIVLTAVRTNEALRAQWDEINFASKIWTIPAERMKAGKEHKVPLSDAALAILRGLEKDREDNNVFPGQVVGAPLSNMACLSVLKRMERSDLTVHGFRSTFRDWAAEMTNYPREVAEMALGHTIGDKVEAAYRRGDLFEKRRRLMSDWARYCAEVAKPKASGKVVALRGKR